MHSVRREEERVLVFVNIIVEPQLTDFVTNALRELPDLEAMYEVTGEFDILCLASTSSIEEFRDLLKNRILKIRGVKSVKSSVILYSHRGLKRNQFLWSRV